MNDEGVCRTAPATPGLSTICLNGVLSHLLDIFQLKKNIGKKISTTDAQSRQQVR